jgi:hypothetical protein
MLSSALPSNPQSEEKNYQIYFGGELGKGFSHDVDFHGNAAGWIAGIKTPRWRYQLNYVYFEEPNPDGLIKPIREFHYIGFDIGRILRFDAFYFTPGLGFGRLTGSFRTRQIGIRRLCRYNSYGWCEDAGEGPAIFEYHVVDAVTLVPSFTALFKPFNHFGIGVNAAGFINSDQGLGKITAFMGVYY